MKLTLYTTKSCSKCKVLKRLLKRSKIPFQEKNLEDTDVMAELVMANLAVFTAPILAINNFVFQFSGELEAS